MKPGSRRTPRPSFPCRSRGSQAVAGGKFLHLLDKPRGGAGAIHCFDLVGPKAAKLLSANRDALRPTERCSPSIPHTPQQNQ